MDLYPILQRHNQIIVISPKGILASMCPLVYVQEMSLETEGVVAKDELILEPRPTPYQLPV